MTAPVGSKTPPPDAQPPSNPPPDTRPPDNRPPRNPPADKRPPSSQRLTADLDTVTLLLRTAQLVVGRRLAGTDPALRMALADRLRLARRAVADLQTSVPAGCETAGPVVALPRAAARAGGPPSPGAGFTLPRTPDLPSFEVGTARPYHASRP